MLNFSDLEQHIAAASEEHTAVSRPLNTYDIHTMKASEHFSVPPEQVTSEQRRAGKQLNFMKLYGTQETPNAS